MGFWSSLKSFGRKFVSGARSFGRKASGVMRWGAKQADHVLNAASRISEGVKDVPILGTALAPVTAVADSAIDLGKRGSKMAKGLAGGIEIASNAKSAAGFVRAGRKIERSVRKF